MTHTYDDEISDEMLASYKEQLIGRAGMQEASRGYHDNQTIQKIMAQGTASVSIFGESNKDTALILIDKSPDLDIVGLNELTHGDEEYIISVKNNPRSETTLRQLVALNAVSVLVSRGNRRS